ncbi:MAG: hypothetical protein ACTSQE_00965 [Candidatus Heimdallarchaeaceae archaeon]
MERFPLLAETTEQLISHNIEVLKKLSALKASKILGDLHVYDSLNRPRSPEEVFHINNFVGLEKEFTYLFELLAEVGLLEKQGEFFTESSRRKVLEKRYEREISEENSQIFRYLAYLFDRATAKYKIIINGEQGKLNSKELINLLDNYYGTEFSFMLRDLFFKNLTTRVSLFSSSTKLNIINWGVGSGYDAVHIADYFGNRASIISIEPENESYRCKVLQDLYEYYNLDFLERPNLEVDLLKETIDIFCGNGLFFFGDYREIITSVRKMLKEEGYLTLILNHDLDLAMNWVFSIYSDYYGGQTKQSLIAKFKHYGFSRIKYVGLNDSFVLLQK